MLRAGWALLLLGHRCTQADCIDDAALAAGVNPFVLRAIGWQESHLDPGAINRNRNGTLDLGAFQINTIHLKTLSRFGISPGALADGCLSSRVAAWHLKNQVLRFGNSWTAVGAYHSVTPALNAAYASRIAAILLSWGVLPPSGPLPAAPPPPRSRGRAGTPLVAAPPDDGTTQDASTDSAHTTPDEAGAVFDATFRPPAPSPAHSPAPSPAPSGSTTPTPTVTAAD